MSTTTTTVPYKNPEYATLTTSITVTDTKAAIDWYTKILHAKVIVAVPTPDKSAIMHAELCIDETRFMMNMPRPDGDRCGIRPPSHGTSTLFYLFVKDVDALFDTAIKAGAKAVDQPTDMFWGDRMGTFVDPFGHYWSPATYLKHVDKHELASGERSIV